MSLNYDSILHQFVWFVYLRPRAFEARASRVAAAKRVRTTQSNNLLISEALIFRIHLIRIVR